MALILFPVVCLLQWIARIENGLNLGNNRIQDIQLPVKYETDSDNELKVTKKVTLKTFVAGHAWPSWEDQYEIMTGASGCTLMVIRLNLMCTYSKNRLIGLLVAIAHRFLLLR